jgi:hypothetical protein
MIESEQQPQPFLPRVGMVWFFVIAAMVALALGVVRYAEQGQALAAAAVLLVAFLIFFFLLSAIFFVVTFMFGVTLKGLSEKNELPSNPFSDGSTPPEQLFPPRQSEDV